MRKNDNDSNMNKARMIIEQIENNIDSLALEMGYNDINDIKQSQWKALLYRLNKIVFNPDNRILKNDNIFNNGLDFNTNHNSYNIDLIMLLIDYFIYLSNKYNKLVSLNGYCMLFGIDDTTFSYWGNSEINSKTFKAWKTLNQYRESSMLDRASDSKNILGLFQVGRRLYNWDSPLQKAERFEVLTAQELPKLTSNDNESQ